MKRFPFVLLFAAACALADPVVLNAGTTLGPVTKLDASADGGLTMTRLNGVAGLRCASAGTGRTGCITPSAQSFDGDKTFSGTVKTPVIDAGIAAIGLLDLRAGTLTSFVPDSTTSSTVAAITLQSGVNVTDSDLVFALRDSAGNSRLSCTEAGSVNFVLHGTDTGAATVAGTNFTSALGAGGISSGATPGGIGGAYSFTAGAGGASAGGAFGGAGGAAAFRAGAGGADNGAAPGGAGGALTIAAGNAGGGNVGGDTLVMGGNAGAATALHATDNGGRAVLGGGIGGAAAAGDTTAGLGGDVNVLGGVGGSSVVGQTSGSGGNLSLKSGNAGATTGGTGNSSGNVTLDTGTPSGAATAGTVFIGTGSANSVAIGRAGQRIEITGPGVMATYETSRILTTQVGSGAMTAGELAVTFSTAFASGTTYCQCTHVNTTNTNACTIKSGSTPTLSTVTFAVASGGTDVVHWSCVGGK